MKFKDVIKMIAPNKNVVLVGGNAVIFWCNYYHLNYDTENLTTDIDFFGTRSDLIEISDSLSIPHHDYFPQMGDPTPNSGKMVIEAYGGSEPIEIDFLRCVTGLGNSDISKKAIDLSLDDVRIRVLHPLHCLESKLSNLLNHPTKRNVYGVKQAEIAIDVARHFLNDEKSNDRKFINDSKIIFEIARSEAGVFSFVEYGLNAFSALPDTLDEFPVVSDKIRKFYESSVPAYIKYIDDEAIKYKKNKIRIDEFKNRRPTK